MFIGSLLMKGRWWWVMDFENSAGGGGALLRSGKLGPSWMRKPVRALAPSGPEIDFRL